MNHDRLLKEAMRNKFLSGIKPTHTMDNVPFREGVVSADFTISGHYRPSTLESPEEYPEVEISAVRDAGGNNITESVSDDEFEQLTIYIENNYSPDPGIFDESADTETWN